MANRTPPPPRGEDSLHDLPVYGGAGGSLQAASYYAAQDFAKQFGRNPTQSELTMLASAYMTGDANQTNSAAGQSAIAQYYTHLQDSPENRQADEDERIKGEIPKHYDSIKQVFASTYGRDPSQAEMDHFATMIAKGDADAYSIAQGLQTLPEYTNKKDQEARTALRGELQTADTDYLTKEVAPALQSHFAQQGRVADASSQGLSAALANAAKETNNQREQYLATVGREDYTNSRQSTINNYLQTLQRQYQVNDQGAARSYQLQDQSTQRGYEMQDYLTQQRAYSDYLQNYGRRQKSSKGLFGGVGSLAGMGVGALLAAPTGGASIPMGMMLGGAGGAGLGGIFDY